MLNRTYVHCPGIGAKTERRLWEIGAATWDDFLDRSDDLRISRRQRDLLTPLLTESRDRLRAGDHAWFAAQLPAREQWRAYLPFASRVAYLDIETNGGTAPADLTVVGLYDGNTLRQFVRGRREMKPPLGALSAETLPLDAFPAVVAEYAVLVTFFGTGFDLPFLRRAYRMTFPQIHIDLCFLLKRLGYGGGLKQVERSFGIARSEETEGLSGWHAVELWRQWRFGSREALETLLAYNAEDVVNLETLLSAAYPRMVERVLHTDDGE